jgi:hypothetical protein
MFDEMKEFIQARTSPELMDALVDLDRALTQIRFTMHQDEIDMLIQMESTEDAVAMVPSIVTIFRTAVDVVLKQFKIEVDGETPLPRLTVLLNFLHTFAGDDDHAAISDIISAEKSADETLCDILELKSQWSAEDWMPYFYSVSGALIETIQEVVGKYEEVIDIPEQVDNELQDRVNWYHTQEEDVFSKLAMDEGVPIGTDMESLYTAFGERVAEGTIEETVGGLVSLCMISNCSLEAMQDEVGFFLEQLYPDLESSQQAHKHLVRHMAKINTYPGARHA